MFRTIQPIRFSFLFCFFLLASALIVDAGASDAKAGAMDEPAAKMEQASKHKPTRKVSLRSYSDALAEFMPAQTATAAKSKKTAPARLLASKEAVKAHPKYNAAMAQKEQDIQAKTQLLREEGRLPQSRMNSYADLLADLMPQADSPMKASTQTASVSLKTPSATSVSGLSAPAGGSGVAASGFTAPATAAAASAAWASAG